ncbi:homoserine dehydrogenase [Tepidibacillus fermentans]|uniref:Homoserine dehydrogenase n=1 Tax=Tepidibacillus fermentans TaxID=1281767 RepID=A0A4R3KGG4_9BACI|nr:homoserine dehydrogenase [Tepidibacillus fermentans]TCS82109.1 homoserine dehydrogenase [Tepidibacillus fermentans]
MESIKVVLLGLGTVGKGVYETIQTHQTQLQAVLGKKIEVVAILVKNKEKKREIDLDPSVILTTDYVDILQLPEIDFVIEMIGGIEPARTYIEQSLTKGCHVITANKELMAFHGKELRKIAEQTGFQLAYEASVAGAIPVIRTLQELLQVNHITKIEAILNGTTNYILTQMRKGKISFEQALMEAKEKGYAEADPSNDIEGWDAFFKLMVLSDLVFDEQPNWNHVDRSGIEQVLIEDLTLAEQFGLRLKLIGSLYKNHDRWEAKVKPTFLSKSHPLYYVEGVENGIVIETDLAGRLFFQGSGAGSLATASAIIEDLVNVWQRQKLGVPKRGVKWKAIAEHKGDQSYWFVIQSKQKHRKNEDLLLKNSFQQFGITIHASEWIELPNQEYTTGYVISGRGDDIKKFLYQVEKQYWGLKWYPISTWQEQEEKSKRKVYA